MAFLIDDEELTQESWLAWAYELMRRGLKPVGEIEVHGPHPYPANRMWGEAECDCVFGAGTIVVFETRPCTSIWDIGGVKVRDKDSGDIFPIVLSKLPDEWRQEMAQIKRKRFELQKENC